MTKVKTFSIPLKIFHVRKAIEELDQHVNEFLAKEPGAQMVSITDTPTADDSGATIGLIRAVAYKV